VVAVLSGKPVQELPGGPGLSEAHQALHLPCPCPGQEVLRRGDLPGQQFDGLEGGYGRGVRPRACSSIPRT
jgi:hypothetical protein